jgi:hypothetical protein
MAPVHAQAPPAIKHRVQELQVGTEHSTVQLERPHPKVTARNHQRSRRLDDTSQVFECLRLLNLWADLWPFASRVLIAGLPLLTHAIAAGTEFPPVDLWSTHFAVLWSTRFRSLVDTIRGILSRCSLSVCVHTHLLVGPGAKFSTRIYSVSTRVLSDPKLLT